MNVAWALREIMSDKPMKLTHVQQLFNFIMYLKHNNIVSYKLFQ